MRPLALRTPTPQPLSAVTRPQIRVESLSVSYDGQLALQEVSLELRPRQITAIVGPSGCGKTTFLHCLNRLTDLHPNCEVRGKIWIGNTEAHASNCDLPSLRRRVGLIFQKPNPFPSSIRQNLHLPLKEQGMSLREEREATMRDALQRVGLLDEIDQRLDHSATHLSGGQQQRLCIARALALDPEVLLLDEPCSALDPMSSAVIEDLLHELRSKTTIVLVTHNLAQARRLADDVAVFWKESAAGRLVEFSNRDEIFSHPKHPLTQAYIRGERG